jgi:hypothetical protein
VRNEGASRRSSHINRRPAVNIHHARRQAERSAVPFNWMVTINFGMSGVPPAGASRVLQKLLAQRFAPWLRRTAVNDNKLKPTYVWSLEAPHGTVSAHILMHLPPKVARAFQARLSAWLEGLAGTSVPPHAVDIRPIYNRIGVTRYILKGIKPAWAAHLAIEPVDQGEIIGKRSGFSRNLGPTARGRSGYKPQRHIV